MSTFGGKIQEIPQISVDRFDGINVQSEAYFLSHCHTDHMKGLSVFSFQDKCVEDNKFLYASKISCIIIKKMFERLKNNVRELCLYKPTTIILKPKSISVIPIPAGHCPGSVMFLFENDKRILYTGDYRINTHDIKKLKSFFDSFGRVKSIDKIYLDTTFFSKDFYKFPKREESIEEVCSIIKEWIDRGNNFIVHLQTSANYGYEYLFTKIYEKVGMPIHVNETIYTFYSLIPEMDKSVTMNSSLTRIHCSCSTYQKVCSNAQKGIMKIVKVSALRWTQDDLEEGVSYVDNGIHYVCYSTHASYEEGVELIRFLKPKQIEACVQQEEPYDNKKMMDLLKEHSKEFSLNTQTKEEPKLFDISDVVRKKMKTESKFCHDNLGLFDSSPEHSLESNAHVANKYQCDKQDTVISTQTCDDNLKEHDVIFDIIGIKPSTSSKHVRAVKSASQDNPDDDIICSIINS